MSTLLDELRAFDHQLRATKTKELLVPGSGGRFQVRYRPPDNRDVLTPVLAAFNADGALDERAERQLLIDCCDEILVRRDGTEDEYEQPEGGRLTFDGGDERWGADVNTARDAVSRLFRLDAQPLAAARHVAALVDWLQGTDAEIRARVEGKSDNGATP